MLETGINIIEWPLLQQCTMSAFGGDALQRNAMLNKSSFIIIDSQPQIVLKIKELLECHQSHNSSSYLSLGRFSIPFNSTKYVAG